MGMQVSIQRSSAKVQLPIRLFLLILFVPAAVVGCRGPWFQKADDFDSLVVTEMNEARTPRGFASSRLRPSPRESSRTAAPRPENQPRTITDSADEIEAGDDLPSERQELFRQQMLAMQAMQNMRTEAAEDLLAKRDESANFSISDDAESASFDNQASKDAKSPHPLSQEGLRDAKYQSAQGTSTIKSTAPTKTEQPKTPANPAQATVVPAGAIEPIKVGAAVHETKIKIETDKSDWRVLASETLAALQAESGSATALSPDQKLSMEAKKRMLSLILDDLDAAMTPIESLQTHEQEFFQHEFQALHAATDPKGNPVINRRWTLALQSHRKAQMNLAAVSNLEILNATFCTEVDSFGIISKFPQYHFHKDQELLLYCELDNFVSTPVKDGYETQLQGSYEIVDSNGRRVADQLLPMDEHVCRNQRRDYFIAYRMYMPQDVKPGRYTLKLTVEDMKGHKFGQTNVDFQIVQ